MRILFVGVFTEGSTNNPQRDCLRKLNHIVDEFSYRSIPNCNSALVLQSVKQNYDMLLIAKAPEIMITTIESFKQNNPDSVTVYWFMDALCNYTSQMQNITATCDYAYFDKENVRQLGLQVNSNCRYVCEGYDENVDRPFDISKEYDVSFIGSIQGNHEDRNTIINSIPDIKIITNAYGVDHSFEVSKSRININHCTAGGASDRIYKILAAKGFLLTNDWVGRELTGLVDGIDLVIYNDVEDVNNKIKLYLTDVDSRDKIAESGFRTVQKLNRLEWAKGITDEK